MKKGKCIIKKNKIPRILNIQRQFTRHYHAYNIPIKVVIRACLEQQRLGYFAWNYLSKRFGVHKFRNTYFKSDNQWRKFLINDIKKKYQYKFYSLERWHIKKIHLASQNANYFLEVLLNNFGNYIKRLRHNFYKMSSKQKKKYKENAYHNNPYHHSWYHIGFFNFQARLDSKRDIFTIAIPNNNTIKKIDRHHIKCPSIGILHIRENMKNIRMKDIRVIKIKVRLNHSNDVQFEFNENYKLNHKKIEHKKVVGIDYNQHQNEILCLYDNQKNGLRGKDIKFSPKRYKKLLELEDMIKKLQSSYQHCLSNTKGTSYLIISDEINYLKARQFNLIDQEYIRFAHLIFKYYDCACMEKLDAKAMRQRGRSNQKNRNINYRLKTLKPYRLLSIFKDIAMKEHKEIIFVNSEYTTQTDYGTNTVKKHPVGQEIWYHNGKEYLRDPNAAHNILDWSLHPKHHILYRLGKVTDITQLISIY